MGDVPSQQSSQGDYARQDGVSVSYAGGHAISSSPYVQGLATAGEYHNAYTQLPQQYALQQPAFNPQTEGGQAQPGRPSPYNMGSLATALPSSSYRAGQHAHNHAHHLQGGGYRYNPAVSSPNVGGQLPLPQYGGQQFFVAPQGHLAPFYPSQLSPPGGSQQIQQQQQQATSPSMTTRPGVGYYSSPVMIGQTGQHPTAAYYGQTGQYPGQGHVLPSQLFPGQLISSVPAQVDPRFGGAASNDPSTIASPFLDAGLQLGISDGRPSVVRGPPRKPRQSGHAIWIGNLPPQTDLMSLVHHVCKEAAGLESLFLISKSNCAFANFKDDASCVAAQQKLHDSKFHSVRLVSRLRKSTVEGAAGVTAPTGPAASVSQPPSKDSSAEHGTQLEPDTSAPASTVSEQEPNTSTPDSAASAPVAAGGGTGTSSGAAAPGSSQKDRFFILKSLTVEDLELSVRTGIWATQAHNEETLNNAYNDAENIYLVFSANKSGEYFGYARMTSAINQDPSAAIEFAPRVQSAAPDLDLPRAIPTEPTEFAPRGRIIDDSARGTIFWEAERDDRSTVLSTNADATETNTALDEEAGSGAGSGTGSAAEDSASTKSGTDTAGGEPKAWGKPFQLEWLSTSRLPFYRTRGLRNPWNSNREVKIARDGTELEPSVGRRLIGLFNRVHSSSPGLVAGAGARGPIVNAVGYLPPGGRTPFGN